MMEEVDRIIIHTLKDIGCSIDEDVRSLGQFSTELVFEASVRCLEIITPGMKIPRFLPENMAARFQHCAAIADGCKSLGYKGEIGYQTFLYSNVIEFRKVLMFLIDKLPREAEKTTAVPLDSLSQTKGMIARVLRTELNEKLKDKDIRSIPFISVPIETGITYPDKITSMNPQEWREYCRSELNWLTEQCPKNNLFPSICNLMDLDNSKTQQNNKSSDSHSTVPYKPKPKPRTRPQVDSGASSSSWLHLRIPVTVPRLKKSGLETDELKNNVIQENHIEENYSSTQDKEEIMEREINHCKNRIAESQLALDVLNEKLTQLKSELNEISGDKMKQVEARQRAATLHSERGDSIVNDAKLKVTERKEKLRTLSDQWEKLSQPLIKRIDEVEKQVSNEQRGQEQKLTSLQDLNEQIDEMNQQISLKGAQKAKFEAELAKAPKEIHRSMYTQRILEIIGSIKKQKDDIDNILKDTRQVQKEISTTSGKLERCYTVVDELIFKNAKKDEHSRRAYKLLATLHADCNDIVSYIRETGTLVREISDIQEQTEIESNKKVGASLARITSDLKQMTAETEMLKTQLDALTKR